MTIKELYAISITYSDKEIINRYGWGICNKVQILKEAIKFDYIKVEKLY